MSVTPAASRHRLLWRFLCPPAPTQKVLMGDRPGLDLAAGSSYDGPETGAAPFLAAVAVRVRAVAVRVRWVGGSLVWFDARGESVARVSADRSVLVSLVRAWADGARGRAGVTALEMEIADRD